MSNDRPPLPVPQAGATGAARAARAVIPFALAFLAMVVFGAMNRDLGFRGDSFETWEVAKSLFAADNPYRSFVEYRGFVVFAISGAVYGVSTWLGTDDVATFRVFAALLFAALTTVSLPALFSRLLGQPASMARTLVFAAVVFYFFRGYFLYPSSDYFALYFLVLALNRALDPGRYPVASFGLAGLWVAAAILSRSNYIVCVPFVLALVWMQARAGAVPRPRMAAGVAVFTAALLAMFLVNQVYAQHRNEAAGPVKTEGLRVLNGQLTNGLKMQKIEWSVDESYTGMVVFAEPTGLALLEEEGITGWLALPQYLGLVAAHPLDFAGIYARHLFNGVDISYPSVYVDDVRRSRLLFSLANYSLLFLGGLVVALRFAGGGRSLPGMVGLAGLVVHVFFCIPFPVEPRFFLALVLAMHGFAIFGGESAWRRLGSPGAGRALALVSLCYVGFLAACFALSARAFEQIEGEPLPLLPAAAPAYGGVAPVPRG
ncbi:MAG: hypothetical protein K0M70_07370 [Arenimonas sp.]|uniref:hypothetical protein n=1 Tax=Arenimonas sp. TaxID=1872635 RepID=UPI0025BBC2FF|nr:hypothetical protein [Arenimonas sp.]MBW8367658.1 hypothetical protein [Arenimonas sp.]